MGPLLVVLFLSIFCHTQGISAVKTTNPVKKIICDEDVFISSLPFEGKVFLHPWNIHERRGDWYHNRAYCAKHCAEMVIIYSAQENTFFHDFLSAVGIRYPGAWLGAQLENKDFCRWYNGERRNNYCPMAQGNYNEQYLTCLVAGAGYEGQTSYRNSNCTGPDSELLYIACQRPGTRGTPDVLGTRGTPEVLGTRGTFGTFSERGNLIEYTTARAPSGYVIGGCRNGVCFKWTDYNSRQWCYTKMTQSNLKVACTSDTECNDTWHCAEGL